MKLKYYTTPSSIASYFGVGFNTPEEQLDIDLGYVEPEFDDDAKARMALGKCLEDAVLNYFEKSLNIIITDRNDKLMVLYEGKIHGKIDGATIFNGLKTGVECKISNSTGTKFTDDAGYLFQVQSYMIDRDFDQFLLLGLYQGKPVYKLIGRNDAIIADVKEMTDFITDVLQGLDTFKNYPIHLVEKYSKIKILEPIENVDEATRDKILRLAQVKESIKILEHEEEGIDAELRERYATGIFEYTTPDNKLLKFTISEQTRENNGYDMDRLSIEHPEIDYSKYRKGATTCKVMRVTLKEKKVK